MVTVQTHFNRQWDWNHQNKIVSNEYEKGISRQYHAIEENEIKSLVSNRIKEHLGTKKYDANLGIDLSQAIAREIREELKMKYKNHKYIIQAVVGELNNISEYTSIQALSDNDRRKETLIYESRQTSIKSNYSKKLKLIASCHFDQRTDKSISITEDNGEIYCACVIFILYYITMPSSSLLATDKHKDNTT